MLSIVGGIILEGIAQWLGKLLVYPYFNVYTYFFAFVLGFSLNWLMIAESYLVIKVTFDYWRRGRKIISNYYWFEPLLYKLLGVVGGVIVPVFAFLMLRDYTSYGGYIFNVSNFISYKTSFLYIVMMFLGTWFVFEYVEYLGKKTSLLKSIFHHYFTPLASILTASFVLAIIMETGNISHGFWVYTNNWPLGNIKVLDLPVMLFLMWPLHYVVFLSFFRAFAEKEFDEIWKGDLIK
ncbi:MAG: hypothetical protein AAB522_03170 [Patescibacteria group bacterium]